MDRRQFVVAVGCSATLAGCSADQSNSPTTRHSIDISSATETIDETEEYCEFDELPAETQSEVKRTIDEGGYHPEEPPTLSDSDCYHKYIEYNGTYYRLAVSVGGAG